ncbi:MAG: metalloendopeptidase, partial [Pontixanthobacter sp.]
MNYRNPLLISLLAAPLLAGTIAFAQRNAVLDDPVETRAALQRALADSAEAETRGLKLEAEARSATAAAEKTANETAALAARIQQAEAGIAAAEARISIIGAKRARLN